MKVLLIRPSFENVFTKIQVLCIEPLELEYLSAICSRENVESRICDLKIKKENIKKIFRDYKPDIIAMTANLVHIQTVNRYGKFAKQILPGSLFIVGGPHAEVNPHDFYFDNVDIVVHSGGFEAFSNIIRMKKNGTLDLSALDGISYRKQGEWVKNKYLSFDLSTLPFPDRTHFNKNKHRFKYLKYSPCAIVKTSYSCPHNCNYCFSTLLNGGKYITRDVENVVDEIESIDSEFIWIVDDTFFVDRQKAWRFIELIKERNIKKNYVLYYRADFIANNEDIIIELGRIGVLMIPVGLEVLDDEVLLKYNKKSTVAYSQKAIEVLKKAGIMCVALLMIDIDADRDYFKKLFEFIKRNELFLSTISVLTPMPGTEQFRQYRERIVTNNYKKWDFVHLVLNPTKMSRIEFYKEYYLLYQKLALLNHKAKILSPNYINAAKSIVDDFWEEIYNRFKSGKSI
jgi:radical SAM superfamily enzyme YgiQ (UPF0313 family)